MTHGSKLSVMMLLQKLALNDRLLKLASHPEIRGF